MRFNLICWKYFLAYSILEKCGKIWKNGRLWPDSGNTARAATARLGSIGCFRMAKS